MPEAAPGWRDSRLKRMQAAAISTIGWPAIEALGGTYSWRVIGQRHLDAIDRHGLAPIHAFWHGRVLAATLFFRDRGIVVITSENFDGEWIAGIIHKFGYGTARGSSSRGGVRALVGLRRELRDGHPVAFTIDGPRGPARVAQPGAVWLAGATGHPVLPFHIEADRAWTAHSWDQHQVPKPGATLSIAIGEPMFVQGTDDDVVESARRDLEARLQTLEASLK
jgi:lysophospholipid acyltransferase (LPLAT)-like uncharacterized protein